MLKKAILISLLVSLTPCYSAEPKILTTSPNGGVGTKRNIRVTYYSPGNSIESLLHHGQKIGLRRFPKVWNALIDCRNYMLGPIGTYLFGRKSNEDRSIALTCNVSGNQGILYGVFDGHNGNQVSHYLQGNFATILTSQTNGTLSEKFEASCLAADEQCKSWWLKSAGSTASLLYINLTTNKLHFINVGDSRTVLYGPNNSILFSTTDHQARHVTDKEYERIQDYYHNKYVTDPTTGQGLALSRSIGDYYSCPTLKNEKIVIAKPDCMELSIDDQSEYVVNATD